MFKSLLGKRREDNSSSPFQGWDIVDFIAPQDMRTVLLDGEERPESALMRFKEYAETLYTGGAYAPSIDLQNYGIPAILYVFPTFVVYHGDPNEIKSSNFMVFAPKTSSPSEASVKTMRISSLVGSNPRFVVEKFSEFLQESSSSCNAFVNKKYGR
jgi:hypothetical protein